MKNVILAQLNPAKTIPQLFCDRERYRLLIIGALMIASFL